MKNDNKDRSRRRIHEIEQELAREQLPPDNSEPAAPAQKPVLSNELRTEMSSFIAEVLAEQSAWGPSVKVTIDWSSAWRIVAMQLIVGVVIVVIWGIANSGL